MPNQPLKQPWESSLREAADKVRTAAAQVEDELQRLVTYVNDEVVPDVRRNGSAALRSAAGELQRLAERMESATRNPPPPKPPSQS